MGPFAQSFITTSATVLASIAAAQGFARKWQANRMSRSRIDQLRVEMGNPEVDLARVRGLLLEIIRQRDDGVLATEHVDVVALAPKKK